MPYATLQDMIDRFGGLELVQRTDRANVPPTTIDEDLVADALEGASSLADGYLGKALKLPLPSTPRVLVDKVCDLARYQLRDESADDRGSVVRNYDAAIGWLKDVAKGIVSLDLGDGEVPPPAGDGAVRATSAPKTLTHDSLKGYV